MTRTVIAITLAAACTLAHAEPRKAGLWESTAVVSFPQGGPQIPPEQLEKMKQMGIQLPFDRPIVIKTCVTPEMAARNEPPRTTREKDGCKVSGYDINANPVTATLVCEGDLKGNGSLKILHDATSYQGTMDFTGVDKRGAPLAMHNTYTGKWLGADCGDVKPPASPPN